MSPLGGAGRLQPDRPADPLALSQGSTVPPWWPWVVLLAFALALASGVDGLRSETGPAPQRTSSAAGSPSSDAMVAIRATNTVLVAGPTQTNAVDRQDLS